MFASLQLKRVEIVKVSEVVYACRGCVNILGCAQCRRVVDCVPLRSFLKLFAAVRWTDSVVLCSIP